jgi:hypothetical protein
MAKRIRTVGKNWADQETAILLSQVERYPEIWDPALSHANKNTTDFWEQIAIEVSRSYKECAQKWTSLKTYYRQELNKEQKKNYVCNWKHKSAMKFYLPYLYQNRVSARIIYSVFLGPLIENIHTFVL